jgi:hypothetical protein
MIKDIRKIVSELKENEAKSLLFLILRRVEMLEQTYYSMEQFSDELREMYKNLLNSSQDNDKIDEACKTIHVIFGSSSSGSLRAVLKDLGLERKEKVIGFSEIFSVGPIWKLQDAAGRAYRYEWLKNHINDVYEEDYLEEDYEADFKNTLQKINAIPEKVPVIIWTGENAHEQTGVRYALYLLHKKKNNIFLINSSEAYQVYFNPPDVKYFPLYTAELALENLKVIYEKSRFTNPLSYENRKQFVQEWESLANKQQVLRIWQNGEIQNVEENFYDQYIINMAQKLHSKQPNKDFMKSAILIGEVLGHLGQYVGDQFLEYRIRHLIYNGIFDIKGIPKAMRYYSIKLR